MLQFTRFFYLAFGLLTMLGGLIGFIKTGSKVSAVAGAICGLLLVTAFFLLPGRLNPALIIGLVVSVALLGQFLPKLLQHDLKPHVIVLVALSAASMVVTILSWYKR